jgi:hypothetical protein
MGGNAAAPFLGPHGEDRSGDLAPDDWIEPRVAVWVDPAGTRQFRRRLHPGVVTFVAAVSMVVVIASVAILVQVLRGSTNSSNAAPPAATPTDSQEPPVLALPPTNVTLQDDLGSVTVHWVDPSSGRVPFIVAGSREGTDTHPLVSVTPGHTSATVVGLNSNYDYCFKVAAVWSDSQIATSGLTCTKRQVGTIRTVPNPGSTA